MEALRRVDLCAVLEAAMSATPAFPAAEPGASEPLMCTLYGTPDLLTAKILIFGHLERVNLPIRAIGGAKAYVREDHDSCTVYLPVSFGWAIQFSQSTPCRTVTELVAAAVAVLNDQRAARVDPRWDGCAALAEVLEPDPDQSKLVGGELADCMYLAEEKKQRATLSFSSSLPPPGEPRVVTVAGTEIAVYEDDDGCDAYWRQRPFPSRFAQTPDYPVRVFSMSCDYSTELAESVIGVLAQPPPSGGTPQHPLLYAPDEPDSPYPGDCAYLGSESNAGDCAPYREVPVPEDLANAYNAQVMCAASADIVRKHFGERLRPVAVSDADRDCHFVEPERTIVVTFSARGGLVGGDPGDREVTVADHPGLLATSEPNSLAYTVSTSDTVDGDGAVELTVSTGPLIESGTPLPPGTDKKAEAALADVLTTYFP
ncbi:hypothetical protein [Actinophytocola sediminis]